VEEILARAREGCVETHRRPGRPEPTDQDRLTADSSPRTLETRAY
jgi:hypothetical protein